MVRGVVSILRPFGIAFGCFVLLNLALAIQDPRLPVTRQWLPIGIPEPGLSLFAGILGAALLAPHGAAGPGGWMRSLLAGTFAGFAVLGGVATWTYYRRLQSHEFSSDLPLPVSALLCLILIAEFVRVFWWRPAVPVAPPPARFFLRGASVTLAFFALTLAHVITYGHEDHRAPADAAVILGAKVDGQGKPCAALADRLDAGIDLFRRGTVRYLIMSGAVDASGRSEPKAMRESYAAFRELVAKFPDSRYAEDSRARMKYLVNALAMYDVKVGQYYFNRGAYVAAANRAQAALTNYPQTAANEQALELMNQSYEKLGLPQLADDAKRVLDRTFPNRDEIAAAKKPWWQLW
jgi:hypothetical protein